MWKNISPKLTNSKEPEEAEPEGVAFSWPLEAGTGALEEKNEESEPLKEKRRA